MKKCLHCDAFYPDDFEKCDTCGYGTLINYENYKKLQTLPIKKREKLYPEEMKILREYDSEKYRKSSPKSQVIINPSAMPIKKEEPIKQNIPHCPTCGSTNIKPLSTTSKVLGVLTIGLASKQIGKSYMCKDCKYYW